MNENLIAHISRYVKLSQQDILLLPGYFSGEHIKKKMFLLKAGQVCRHNYFVSKGCLRMFFIDEKGREQITHFAIENWWISDYMHYGSRQPAVFSIQAIEDTEIISLDYTMQDKLFAAVPQLERYFRLNLQRAYGAAQVRVKYFHEQSREEIYRQFCASFPGFVQRIPQYMLASFLGFTPEYLSELRSKKI